MQTAQLAQAFNCVLFHSYSALCLTRHQAHLLSFLQLLPQALQLSLLRCLSLCSQLSSLICKLALETLCFLFCQSDLLSTLSHHQPVMSRIFSVNGRVSTGRHVILRESRVAKNK